MDPPSSLGAGGPPPAGGGPDEPHDASPLPAVNAPKGGGAVRGMGEKFSVAASTGAAEASIPFMVSPGRAGSTPQLELSYSSGSGNGPFGIGWHLSLPSISRKADKGMPVYDDAGESDVFIFAGIEDLVPLAEPDQSGVWTRVKHQHRVLNGHGFQVVPYQPRIEGPFLRIERWTRQADGDIHWQVTSPNNVISIYGDGESSRVFDSQQPNRIFTWLLTRTLDDKGNAMHYEYKSENADGVNLQQSHELYRPGASRQVARYLKRVRYSNQQPCFDVWAAHRASYHLGIVFDYGDHDLKNPLTAESSTWDVRQDPFSTYRPGFEVRSYRLCKRVLMFHHFPDEPDIGNDCLVGSTDFSYSLPSTSDNGLAQVQTISLLAAVSKRWYVRQDGSYLQESLPPLEMEYTQPVMSTQLQDVAQEVLETLPLGVDDTMSSWLDLNAEGIPGILCRQSEAFYFSRNLGNGKFDPPELLSSFPTFSVTKPAGQLQWMGLLGDGYQDLVQLDSQDTAAGYYRRSLDGQSTWSTYHFFPQAPRIDWKDPNTHLVDLSGDGLADVLHTDGDEFSWFASEGEDGFSFGGHWRPPLDENFGPRLLLSTGDETILLADMTGDGLSDMLRVRNGEICYWPSLGYGKFGAKVSMDNAPYFDDSSTFRQTRIRMGDIDGSGTTDLLYLRDSHSTVYFNESGNSWSGPHQLPLLPGYSDSDHVQLVDLLGHGTACLVWSSPLPAYQGRQIRYVDLMKQGKPYLLKTMRNNLGSEKRIEYQSSTEFYLNDSAAGQTWLTRLPYPVQVVSKTITTDFLSHTKLVSRCLYHDGYFDPVEREFRGFGYVETIDCESFDIGDRGETSAQNSQAEFTSPPVLTKSFYEMGALHNGRLVSREYTKYLYHEDPSRPQFLLSESPLPQYVRREHELLAYDLTGEESTEAYRALKGSLLRQEIYALDGTSRQGIPYQVSETRATAILLQPRRPPESGIWIPGMHQQGYNHHAVFFHVQRESITVDYERNNTFKAQDSAADPRRSHSLILETDYFGNSTLTLALAYGREFSVPGTNQEHTFIKLDAAQYTNAVRTESAYRNPILWDSASYELRGFQLDDSTKLNAQVNFWAARKYMMDFMKCPTEVPFEAVFYSVESAHTLSRRLISRKQQRLQRDDFSAPLPFGVQESLAIQYESYTQVLTPGLAERMSLGTALLIRGGYVHLQDCNWWSPSGRTFYSQACEDTPNQQREYAMKHFFLPQRFRDPFYSPTFNTESFVFWDQYDLFPIETVDAKGNRVSVGRRSPSGVINAYDYRTFQAKELMDANRNVVAYAYDILARVAATALMGKLSLNEGDNLSGVDPYLCENSKLHYLQNPIQLAPAMIGGATTRYIYDQWAFFRTRGLPDPLPPATSVIARETHVSQLLPSQSSELLLKFSYADGSRREIQQKALSEPSLDKPAPRWICSGWTIYNNKGSPVKKYEPTYTATHQFQDRLVHGVSSINLYDPLQRVVGIILPNHSFTKTVITAWGEQGWDANDTVLLDPATDGNISGLIKRLQIADYKPSWYEARIHGQMGFDEKEAAEKTSVHCSTPTTRHFDSLGRITSIDSENRFQSWNGQLVDEFQSTTSSIDISGNVLSTRDQLERLVQIAEYDMSKALLKNSTMEAGTNWYLSSVTKKVLYSRDSRAYERCWNYDLCQRPTEEYLEDGGRSRTLITKIEYGEDLENSEELNARLKQVSMKDQSGVKRTAVFDFKGNVLESSTRLIASAGSTIDWSSDGAIQPEKYLLKYGYDAVNRIISLTQPDGTVQSTAYTRASQVQMVCMRLRNEGPTTEILCSAQYNARNQVTFETFGNGAETAYTYDDLTFALTRKTIHRRTTQLPSRPRLLDLRYCYDPSGNVTSTTDNGQETVFFRQHIVKPRSGYEYDALYRLIFASGREHAGQCSRQESNRRPDVISNQHANDGKAMVTYLESYRYDRVGNTLAVRHAIHDRSQNGWTRHYSYDEPSQLEPDRRNNRLSSTRIWNSEEKYAYTGDEGLMGNSTSIPGVTAMSWDFRNQLQSTSTSKTRAKCPETTWYRYDNGGGRTQKMKMQESQQGEAQKRMSARAYIGTYELYREYNASGEDVRLEYETLRISAGSRMTAIVDLQTKCDQGRPKELIRYQFSNSQHSIALELDQEAQILSYEEYFPYGETSYHAVNSQLETPKRYRYSGKEKDRESGLYYFGARYYAAWVGRWISPDHGGYGDGPNLYQFVRSNPISLRDPDGANADAANPLILVPVAAGAAEGGFSIAGVGAAVGGFFTEAGTWIAGSAAVAGAEVLATATLIAAPLLIIFTPSPIARDEDYLPQNQLRAHPDHVIEDKIKQQEQDHAPPKDTTTDKPKDIPVEGPKDKAPTKQVPKVSDIPQDKATPEKETDTKKKVDEETEEDEEEEETTKKGSIWHHVAPQQFAWFFKQAGINIHEAQYGVVVGADLHSQIHYYMFNMLYNMVWKKWILDNYDFDKHQFKDSIGGTNLALVHANIVARIMFFKLGFLIGGADPAIIPHRNFPRHFDPAAASKYKGYRTPASQGEFKRDVPMVP